MILTLKKLILTIGYTLMPAKCVTVTKKRAGGPTISGRAMDIFMAYVRHVMWNALGGLMLTYEATAHSSPYVVHALRRSHRPVNERDVH